MSESILTGHIQPAKRFSTAPGMIFFVPSYVTKSFSLHLGGQGRTNSNNSKQEQRWKNKEVVILKNLIKNTQKDIFKKYVIQNIGPCPLERVDMSKDVLLFPSVTYPDTVNCFSTQRNVI